MSLSALLGLLQAPKARTASRRMAASDLPARARWRRSRKLRHPLPRGWLSERNRKVSRSKRISMLLQ
jgi:hypothetical protein